MFEFSYKEKKGNVTIEISNNQIDDIYKFEFDVKYYKKDLV